MPQITVTEQGGSGRYINFGDAAALRDLFNRSTGATIILYVKPGDQAAINYPFCKCDSSGYGMRVVATSGELLGAAVYRGATTTQLSSSTSAVFTQNAWQHWQVTFPGNGELSPTNLNFYIDASAALAKTSDTSATSPITSDSGLSAFILNRPGLGRHFIGDTAYVAAWTRVLSDAERTTVRDSGPLSVPSGLTFCFANGQDYGPNAVAVVDRTTQVAGSTPTNIELGSAVTELSGAAVAQASASGALSGGDAAVLSGAAVAQASASGAIGTTIVIVDTPDRGTLDLANCSVTPNGSTPTISVRNMYSAEDNTSGALFSFFSLTGINGLRPVIDVDRSNMQLTGSGSKFKWSYTGALGSWSDFASTTQVTTPNVYRSQHDTAFTQDTVYIAMNYPWRIGYTLPWIQSLESSGHVGYAPSGGSSYQFGTRTTTVDHLGATIPAQPLYSFKIGSGGNAPDGLPKRKLVMFSGLHASEDVGNYALKGAVEFLVSSDALAVSVRQWFDAFVYPVVASAGRAGGAQRGDFQTGYMSEDANRAWDDIPVLETVTKHKAAVLADVGATIHVFLDFHGDRSTTANLSYFEAANSSDPYYIKWDAALDSHLVTTVTPSQSAAFTSGWAKGSKGCNYSVSPECGFVDTYTTASKEAFGAAQIKAISTLIAQGEWGHVAISGAALGVASASGALTTEIPLSGAAVATSSASGSMEAQVSLSGAALAQAVSSALLSTGIVMTAAAVAQAAAQGTLTTAIQMLGSAQAQAGGSGSLTTSTGGLEGNAQASASAAASLTAEIRLTGAAVAQASAGGALAGASIDLAGAAVATAYAGADLAVTIALTAQAISSAIASGGLITQIVLDADATAQAQAGAALSGGAGLVLPAARSVRILATGRRPAAIQTCRR